MGEVLPIGAEMTQRRLHRQRPTQTFVKAHKAGNLEHTAQLGGECLHGGLLGLSLFYAAQLIRVFTEAWLVSTSKPSM